MNKVPVVAIIGRSNVGKSTLFNTIASKRLAVVDDYAGVTRDRNYAYIKHYQYPFTLVDTGGVLGEEEQQLHSSVRYQAELAIDEADIILAILDGLHGIHPQDELVAELLRKSGKPVIWVVNKCEKPATQDEAAEFYSLGVDQLYYVSAAHKVGTKELVQTLTETIKEHGLSSEHQDQKPNNEYIRVAVLGKPNVGKSTLINRLLGEDRLVTSNISGTTRDSIEIKMTREGRDYIFYDTAGLRKKARIDDQTIERYSNLRALRSLAMCDVALLLVDAVEGKPSEQDAKIAGLAHERGKALVIVVNKWDAVEKDHKAVKEFERNIRTELKFATYAPIVFLSALTGKRCPKVYQAINTVFDASHTRIQTSDVNKILTRIFEKKPPPVYRGSPIKFFFATQSSVAPPEFVIFMDHPQKVHFSYQRYIKNSLRKAYGFEGSDIKLVLKKRRESKEAA